MTGQFRKVWKELGGAETGVNRTVTLASLVEKETAVPGERPEVASVYANRLRSGMKLDCDPTTIYAALLQGRYRGTIYRSDLDSTHPYNTYRNPGLPPGPIANPGVASLKAAIAPAETEFLYFVAKPGGSGAHSFSRTLQNTTRPCKPTEPVSSVLASGRIDAGDNLDDLASFQPIRLRRAARDDSLQELPNLQLVIMARRVHLGEEVTILPFELREQVLLAGDGPEVVQRRLGDIRHAGDERRAAVGLAPTEAPFDPWTWTLV